MGGRAGEAFLKEAPPPHPHPRTLYVEKAALKGLLFQRTEVLKGWTKATYGSIPAKNAQKKGYYVLNEAKIPNNGRV